MPQIAIAPIASPSSSPPAASPATSETSAFAPHLEQAINQRQQPAVTSSPDDRANKEHSQASLMVEEANTEPDLQDGSEIGIGMGEEREKLLGMILQQHHEVQDNLGQFLVSLITAPPSATADRQHPLELVMKTSTMQLIGEMPQQQDVAARTAPTQQFPALQIPAQLMSSDPTKSQLMSSDPAKSAQTTENPLLTQLQHIIESREESISLTITGSGKSTTLSATGGNIDLRVTNLPQTPMTVVASSDSAETDHPMALYGVVKGDTGVEQTNTPATPRHTLNQQHFESKMLLDGATDKESNTDANQQQQTATPTKAGAGGETALSPGTFSDTPSSFSQALTQSLEGGKPLGTESSRPLTLPSGTTVHQEEVIRQIAERMQLGQRDNTTRVNLKLHPAELGELRIDLTVKQGTVRANVIASTQIAQDIIEKNMPRLRSILENQGFSIGQMLVSTTSRSIDDFNLFDQHLFGREDSPPSSSRQGGDTGTTFSLDAMISAQEPALSVVNLKI